MPAPARQIPLAAVPVPRTVIRLIWATIVEDTIARHTARACSISVRMWRHVIARINLAAHVVISPSTKSATGAPRTVRPMMNVHLVRSIATVRASLRPAGTYARIRAPAMPRPRVIAQSSSASQRHLRPAQVTATRTVRAHSRIARKKQAEPAIRTTYGETHLTWLTTNGKVLSLSCPVRRTASREMELRMPAAECRELV